MRAHRHFGNPFYNPGELHPGRYRGFYRWRESISDSFSEPTQTKEQNEGPGLKYVGPCRCGRGPHAFYRNEKGELIHASRITRQ